MKKLTGILAAIAIVIAAVFLISNPNIVDDGPSIVDSSSRTLSEASRPLQEPSFGEESSDPPPLEEPASEVAGSLTAHFIDVGNADAILIECNGEFMLIDAGENNQGGLVTDYLLAQGVDELEYAIGSHPHSDHIGGLDIVLSNIPAKQVLMPDSPHTTKTYSDLLSVIEEKDLDVIVPEVGDVFPLSEATITVLSPARDYEELNDDSIVVRVVFGETSFLLTGDATRVAERDILDSGLTLDSDVLKVGHHGSHSSSSYVFLREVMPEYAVITCGAGNEYKHPHEEVTSRLSDLQKVHGTETYRSDLHGTIIITSDGQTIEVSTEK